MFQTAVTTFGPVEVLVNNAGVYGFGPIDGFKEEDYQYQFNTKVKGVFTSLGRMGQPEDVAETVVYLASSKSGWVTGERIGASGGLK